MFNQEMCFDLRSNSLNQHRKKSVLNSKEKIDVVTATASRMCFLLISLAVLFYRFDAKRFGIFFRVNLMVMQGQRIKLYR